jgi:para-nitrobenzyl esterase
MKRLTGIFVVIGMLIASTLAFAALPDPIKLESGLVSGIPGSRGGIRVFKGIPYAAPPVGALRWRAPQLVATWNGVRRADHFGPMCMQAGPASGMSEDCLYLNIWTAANSNREKRPVMVWSHGGGYTMGSGDSPQFDGEALAAKGVILVTYNYRLGVFGFFAHPDLTRESEKNASGNYGLMDLAAVLRWVRKNIAAFGGDPQRVTIFGVSAGAGLVSNMVGSPETKGLFRRAIAQSGGWMGLRIGKPMMRPQAEAAGVKVAESMGAKSIAELREKPAADLLKSGRGTGPIVDGWFIPEDLSSIYLRSEQNDVDLLVGSNQDEGTFFSRPGQVKAEQFISQSRQRFGSFADEFLKLYPAGSDKEAESSQLASFRDELAWHMRTWAGLKSMGGNGRSYLYYFTHEPPAVPGTPSRGATHGAETPYVFQNLVPAALPWKDLDRRLADIISSYWSNFAAKGDPNGRGLPNWPEYQNPNGLAMVLGDKVEPAPPERVSSEFFDRYNAAVRTGK